MRAIAVVNIPNESRENPKTARPKRSVNVTEMSKNILVSQKINRATSGSEI